MKIAVASGKGGTGKTTVCTNLVRVLSGVCPVQYVDCDVEEPNGHLFLNANITQTHEIETLIPQVDEEVCTLCGKCSDFCAYNAIAVLGITTLVFPEMCHSCGGCALICPEKAITEVGKPIGVVRIGTAGDVGFADATLKVGEALSPPLIRALKKHVSDGDLIIYDAPPGTSCPVVTSLEGVDFVLLVAEPTPFGFNDLKIAVEMVRKLQIPLGVFINRYDMGDSSVEDFCREESIDILGRLPDDVRIAKAYSRGKIASDAFPEAASVFSALSKEILRQVYA